ncbi:MAG: COX15/CtaA family protein [Spirochaetota bacterium]|nr:COX15/CtaA family protein [Spirochaetota bacterium]
MTKSDELSMRVHKQVAKWLIVCLSFVFLIIILGGATRLTGSGLSMVKLKLFRGVIPPSSEADWKKSFEEYQKTPEYIKTYKDRTMSVESYKSIFWLEYFHRLVGRFLAGFVFLIPFLYFLIRYFFINKVLSASLIVRLVIMFALGGLQAAVGWIMVQSGMNTSTLFQFGDLISVNPYNLTLHLAMAVVTYIYMVRVILSTWYHGSQREKQKEYGPFTSLSLILIIFAVITILSGGFVAGTKAGLLYQSDLFISLDALSVTDSITQTQTIFQFIHRWLATVLFLLIILFWSLGLKKLTSGRLKTFIHTVFAVAIAQFTLGITTLISFTLRDIETIALGTIHQGTAIILLTFILLAHYYSSWRIRRP